MIFCLSNDDLVDLREEFLKVPSDKKATQGGSALFECVPPPGLPTPKIEWLKQGMIVSSIESF